MTLDVIPNRAGVFATWSVTRQSASAS